MARAKSDSRRSGRKKGGADRVGGRSPAEDVVAAVFALGTVGVAAATATAKSWRARRRGRGRKGRALGDGRPGAGAAGHSTADGDVRSRPAGAKESKVKARLRRAGERFVPLGWALRVQERYAAVHGNNLAAAVTFQSFVSLFPLLLVAVAVIGWVAGSGVDVAGRVVGDLGLSGDARRAVSDAVAAARESRRAASVLGLAGLLWSGLGLVNALQYAYDQVWQVEERGLKDKAYGAVWLLGATVLLVATSATTTALRFLPADVLVPVGGAVAFAANVALWLWTGKLLPNTRVPWRAVLPGAVAGAVGLEVLKILGAFYLPRVVSSSSQLYGSLGVVFAILAWLFFFGRLVVYAAVVNVVVYERREGTVSAVVEVPRQPGAAEGQEVSRMGRIPRPAGRSAR